MTLAKPFAPDDVRRVIDQVLKSPDRPPYAMELASVKTLPPILYPATMLNVAVNYREHGREMAGRTTNPSGAPEPGLAPPGPTGLAGRREGQPQCVAERVQERRRHRLAGHDRGAEMFAHDGAESPHELDEVRQRRGHSGEGL